MEERVRDDMKHAIAREQMNEINVLEWLENLEKKFPYKSAVNDGRITEEKIKKIWKEDA